MERAERIVALGFGAPVRLAADPGAVADARAHPGHRGAAVRPGVAAGQRAEAGSAGQPLACPPSRPSDRAGLAPASEHQPPLAPGRTTASGAAVVDVLTPAFKVGRPVGPRAPGAGARCAPAMRSARASSRITPARRRMAARNLQRADPSLAGPAACSGRRRGCSSPTAATGSSRSGSPGCPSRRSTPASRPRASSTSMRPAPRGTGRSWPCPTSAAGSGPASGSPGCRGIPVTAVVEQLDPPGALRVVRGAPPLHRHGGRAPRARRPARPPSGRCGTTTCSPCCATATSRATASRSSSSASAPPCPAGPAVLALRTGAPILPTAIYFDGAKRHGVVQPALDTIAPRRRSARTSPASPRTSPHALEELIRVAPEQWHLLQPNWPSATGAS